MRERENLIARIRNLRRASAAADTRLTGSASDVATGRVDALENRIAHLEQLLEGLQDSVHREATRQGKRLNDLEAQIQPAALGAALSKDIRERGL
jgi:hypothetical protein